MTRQRRFTLAVAFTIFVVAYVVVPWVSDVIDGLGTYQGFYEPKDFARSATRPRRVADPGAWSSEALVKGGLCVLLVVVWFMATSGGQPRGRSR